VKGLVIKSSRNVFTVREEGAQNESYECRIKGKVLKCGARFYNPLAPGDIVYFEADIHHKGKGMITGLSARRNFFTRYNRKGRLPQILASNVDLAVCVSTPRSPPGWPRFIDRGVIQAAAEKIPAILVINKLDLGIDEEASRRLSVYKACGCAVLPLSARTGEGLEAFRAALGGKLAVLLGQSGVGKSSIINALSPEASLKTGALNEKYDRGNHTTAQADLLELCTKEGFFRVIDTPGVRQFVPCGVEALEAALFMPDIAKEAGRCAFGRSCAHIVEPGCAVREAAARGVINSDRYESYLRLYEELSAIKQH
jgi:ribosome biogenesis GTPase